MKAIRAWLAVAGACCAAAAGAEPPPLWELGLGGYGLSLPAYRGTTERQNYLVPFPYLQYRGERLRWDRDGGRLRVLGAERARLDLSLAASPPADTEGDSPRAGMPDLDPTVELGLQLEVLLAGSGNRQSWTLVLPVRKVTAIDSDRLRGVGWVFSPYLQYEHRGQWKTTVSAGPLFATEPYHDYFYQVDPTHAAPGRPIYNAQGGYSGSRVTVGVSRRLGRYWVGAFARYDHLGGATFADSPLVETDHALMFGAGIAWIFAESSRPGVRTAQDW